MATFLDKLLLGGKAKAEGPGVLRQAIAHETGRSPEPHYVFLNVKSEPDEVPVKASQALKQAKVDSKPTQVFQELNGFSVELVGQEADRLRRVPMVQSVELDQPLPLTPPVSVRPVSLDGRGSFEPLPDGNAAEIRLDEAITEYFLPSLNQNSEINSQSEAASLSIYNDKVLSSGEILPYGVQAVWDGQDISSQGNVGSGTYAFVIDSGVLDTTGDLLVNQAWSKSWVSGESAFTDGNGHGTHVAGTIAALANDMGLVGVAPGAEVISLKIFDSFGGGASYSTVISAINYAVEVINENNLDKSKTVINMSLGGPFDSGLDTAVKNAADQGIKFAIAAGNSGDDADGYSPASAGDHENVYTVSAVDNQYQMPGFTNWDDPNGGDDVDVAAPGVFVRSYYKNGQQAYLSGTSMAAPHVAGLLLMGGVKEGEMVTPNWANQSDPFALAAEMPAGFQSLYSTVSGKYYYGNGDYYTFSGSVSFEYGGGNYEVGDKIYASTSSKDSFTQQLNETGNQGYYQLESVSNQIGSTVDSIAIGEYFDFETGRLSEVAVSSAGSAGFGSESGYLTTALSEADDLISNYQEADLPLYSTVSGKYYYGNGDYYTFSGSVSFEYGGGNYEVGDKIYASTSVKDAFNQVVNETDEVGYYSIDYASNQIGITANHVVIDLYYDSETSTIATVSSAVAGVSGLGSEAAFLTEANSLEYDSITSYYVADYHSEESSGGESSGGESGGGESGGGESGGDDSSSGELNYTVKETQGAIDLVTDAAGFAFARTSDGAVDDITYGGQQMRDGYWSGWSLKAAETINGVNQVAWQHSSGTLSIWNTDANWSYSSSSFYGSATSSQGTQAETSFGIDFNGDQFLG